MDDSMFLSIATTSRPATDPGYLLHEHPERCPDQRWWFRTGSMSSLDRIVPCRSSLEHDRL
jgi:hypothetical protein